MVVKQKVSNSGYSKTDAHVNGTCTVCGISGPGFEITLYPGPNESGNSIYLCLVCAQTIVAWGSHIKMLLDSLRSIREEIETEIIKKGGEKVGH